MPKLKSKESERNWDEYNEVRRNLKRMSLEDMERYIKGESISKILGKKYKHGMK
jgi:hypothetical protein